MLIRDIVKAVGAEPFVPARRQRHCDYHHLALVAQEMALLTAAACDGVCIIDVQGHLIDFNDAFGRMLGFTRDQLDGLTIMQWHPHWDCLRMIRQLSTLRRPVLIETQYRHVNGALLDIEATCALISIDDIDYVSIISRDIAERKHLEDQLRIGATVFDLHLALLVMDADCRIMQVNRAFMDMSGFRVDELIGKKFTVLHAGADHDAFAAEMACAVRAHGYWRGEMPMRWPDDACCRVGCAIAAVNDKDGGVTNYVAAISESGPRAGDRKTPAERASAPLSDSRRAAQAIAVARLQLDSAMRHSLAHNGFTLHYQPQVAHDGALTGVEALVRWRHPQRGWLSPTEFIPVAEESGLIIPLGLQVLSMACHQLMAWKRQFGLDDFSMSVNVSARQLRHPDFVGQVMATLDRTKAHPDKLKLELTESMLVENVDDTIAKIGALKAQGVGFSLDDFGTGYSSLAYLKKLPLDQLKIDKSFVRDVLIDQNDAAISRMIITLGTSLGLEVIAEGVETEAQRAFLFSIGCRAFQGYLFGRPMAVDVFNAYLAGGIEHPNGRP
jgi:PAS domain S-box-containing protein